ncbi:MULTISPECIES: DegT/DnrJ/EryC1/StrS family aminotransferase [unclassified Caballeronia]|uniref:DegT/DnrJ/EryC1/StrS family aminotransferase n=1 Tax=unclassified Caballeronia TaxID=2646786 RepID=UPI0028583FA5|nr:MULTISPECIES: DegT/DnrJ/EryC1/StrS family aminotransferase [unclassified Caballeronia]MDR5751441.1 DegT/DnrJ/EryC1/StrS family aminotransferase [Caballeronia sp. LZ024]MDR5844418.1 DegT/DnrJ/EryC1/StrS family aminotransferase [Caballeronia sp. LZ031]
MNVPFLELSRVNAQYKQAFFTQLNGFYEAGMLIGGSHVTDFENAFAAYCGTKHCVGVGNGLDALTLSLRALGIGPGDEVIVPAQTFVATWLSVTQVGATNVPVDVEPRSANLDAALVEAAITPRTKAIIAVHLYGATANVAELKNIASRHKLFLVEDAAQAHGDVRDGKKAGAHGDIAAFSFYPSKNLGALGDAGAVVTDSEDLAQRVRELGNYGSAAKYYHHSLGTNSRLDPLQALFLSIKLKELDQITESRRRIAARYDRIVGMEPGKGPVYRLLDPQRNAVWHNYVLVCDDRDSVQQQLQEAGVGTSIHYPVIPAAQECYASAGFSPGASPVALRLSQSVLSLPIGEYMTDAEIEHVCGALASLR